MLLDCVARLMGIVGLEMDTALVLLRRVRRLQQVVRQLRQLRQRIRGWSISGTSVVGRGGPEGLFVWCHMFVLIIVFGTLSASKVDVRWDLEFISPLLNLRQDEIFKEVNERKVFANKS